MAVGVSGFNETAYFEAYNPHPYQGGYDIVLTYGSPLPPSPTICYPISAAASSPPLNPQLPPPSVPVDPLASPEAVGRENDLPEAELGSSYGLGFRDFGLDWCLNLPPFMMAADGNSHAGLRYDAEELRYWGQFRRAAEYIFGYSQGLGERRIGVDSLGIPIYAHRNRGSDSVHVQIEPWRIEKLNYHLESPCRVSLQCSSTCNNNREDENYKFSNLSDAYMVQDPLHTDIDPVDGFYEELVNSERRWELPYKGYEIESNVYDVAREYEQLSHTELEPYWSSWAQYPGYHGISEDVYSGSQPGSGGGKVQEIGRTRSAALYCKVQSNGCECAEVRAHLSTHISKQCARDQSVHASSCELRCTRTRQISRTARCNALPALHHPRTRL
ncbi:hypothetical protein KSP40_PGU004915 [Platanthera guangdongensis]|uniref:Uncharacterized protein n=1 Tax=Platanthera guangdongensis TaxID=2320717 RepID=A0ABR2MJI7_9ASPA